MEQIQTSKIKWGTLSLFTLLVGITVACFSVASDHVPYLEEGQTLTVGKWIFYYLAIMLNSLPVWFIIAMVVGYFFANTVKQAVLVGSLYTVITIALYLYIGNMYTGEDVMPLPFSEQLKVYFVWYGMSFLGGVIGGSIGFLCRKKPNWLWVLVSGIVLQLFVNGTRSWQDSLGVAQNVTLCVVAVSISLSLLFLSFFSQKNKQ